MLTRQPKAPKKTGGRPVENPAAANFPGPAQYHAVGHTIASRVSLRPLSRAGLDVDHDAGTRRHVTVGRRADPVIYGGKQGGWVSVNEDARAIMDLEERLSASSRAFEETLNRFLATRGGVST